MKICPQCNAHYEDSIFFCLGDGEPLKVADSQIQSNPATFEKTLTLPTEEKTGSFPTKNELTEEKTLALPVESPTEQKSLETNVTTPPQPLPTAKTDENAVIFRDIPKSERSSKMDASMINGGENQSRFKVSISTRLITALIYTIPAIGGALSSILLMNVFRALSENESAGVMAVMGGMKEATFPTIASLYLGAVCGIAVIVVLVVWLLTQTKTASPPSWFFVISGLLCFLPAAFFWRAGSLVIEVLSPGSTLAAGGFIGIAGNLQQLLLWSLVAAPLVFVLLIVLSVIPLSSRKRAKWSSLIAAIVIEILLIASAVAFPFLIGEPKRKNELVNLPVGVKYADSDYDLQKETSIILTLTSDNKLYQGQTIITKEELPEKLKRLAEGKTPDKRLVYFKADVNASFENVVQVFDLIRKADLDKIGLVVVGAKTLDDPYQIAPVTFEVKLPALTNETVIIPRPNPLTLVAMLGKDGKLKLNNEDMGVISDSKRLENKLAEVFKDRELNGIFREGTNEVEKTVFLKASKSGKYSDFIKLVEAVKVAGAQPIGIQIDDLN